MTKVDLFAKYRRPVTAGAAASTTATGSAEPVEPGLLPGESERISPKLLAEINSAWPAVKQAIFEKVDRDLVPVAVQAIIAWRNRVQKARRYCLYIEVARDLGKKYGQESPIFYYYDRSAELPSGFLHDLTVAGIFEFGFVRASGRTLAGFTLAPLARREVVVPEAAVDAAHSAIMAEYKAFCEASQKASQKAEVVLSGKGKQKQKQKQKQKGG